MPRLMYLLCNTMYRHSHSTNKGLGLCFPEVPTGIEESTNKVRYSLQEYIVARIYCNATGIVRCVRCLDLE